MDDITITISPISMLSLLGIFYLILSDYWRIGKNKVHFYVARDKDKTLWLYLGKPVRKDDYFCHNIYSKVIANHHGFKYLGLNIDDYKDLKWEDEPKEVFLNLED